MLQEESTFEFTALLFGIFDFLLFSFPDLPRFGESTESNDLFDVAANLGVGGRADVFRVRIVRDCETYYSDVTGTRLTLDLYRSLELEFLVGFNSF